MRGRSSKGGEESIERGQLRGGGVLKGGSVFRGCVVLRGSVSYKR